MTQRQYLFKYTYLKQGKLTAVLNIKVWAYWITKAAFKQVFFYVIYMHAFLMQHMYLCVYIYIYIYIYIERERERERERLGHCHNG